MHALILLIVLFTMVLMGLVYKKYREGLERTWFEFLLDSSKQIVGSGWLHVLNILFSLALNSLGGGDECDWYYIHITMDTTLGLLVNYSLHRFIYTRVLPQIAPDICADNDLQCGDYGRQGYIEWNKYWLQLGIWLIVVTVMKLTMILLMLVGHDFLVAVTHFILFPATSSTSFKLLIVMVINPLVMNTFQFWVTDSFLKKDTNARIYVHNTLNPADYHSGFSDDKELEELSPGSSH